LIPGGNAGIAYRVVAARAMRSFCDGYIAVLIAPHLFNLGFDATAVGLLITVSMLGSALLTLAVGFLASRFSLRGNLLAAAALMAMTGIGFGVAEGYLALMLIAFVGTINPSGGDVSVFLPLEHTALSHAIPGTRGAPSRTALFARYSLAGSLAAAVGALAATLIDEIGSLTSPDFAMRSMFIFYGMIGLATMALYRRLPVAIHSRPTRTSEITALGPNRRKIFTLAALFSVDAFAGGFVVNSLMVVWLLQRFGLTASDAGMILFVTGICSAFSYLLSVRIANRFGLINTMVFTHLPANIFLIGAALAPDVAAAVMLLVLRSLLSQMDVPPRSAYVMAIVTPVERPAAASVTSAPRSLATAGAPVIAGALLAASSFGWPLIIAGGLKIAYDVALYALFAKVKPADDSAPDGSSDAQKQS
jgi:MFS family permease